MTLFPTYTLQTNPNDHRRRRQQRQPERVRRQRALHQHHRQHLAPRRLPDHARHHPRERAADLGPGSSVSDDSLVFRIKYAYAQFNLDDWMTRGSWVRLGIQQTPWVDFEEGIYRYRFQGTVFAERVPLPTAMTSADAGASFHYNFPSNYGDIHVGVYNGENYQRVEVNDQKALEFRGTRPAVRAGPAGAARASRAPRLLQRPLRRRRRAQAADGQRHLRAPVRERRVRLPERQRPDVGDRRRRREPWLFDLGDAAAAARQRRVVGSAAAVRPLDAEHARPRSRPRQSPEPGVPFNDQKQNRTIVGVSYWFPHQGNVSTAHPLDYDGQSSTTSPLRRPRASRSMVCSTSRRGTSMNIHHKALAQRVGVAVLLVARRRGRSRRSRSTARARRSRIRSTRSGSPSTTSCTRTSQINYQSIGSGGGIRQITKQTVFFGATDGPMTDEQLQAAPGKILHFPTVLGAVVPVYNIPDVTAELKFTGPVLADIFLGKITKWNDPAIAKLNAGVDAAGDRHHRRAPLRRLGHDLHLGRLPVEGVARVEEQGRRRHVGELAGRRRRQGQRGRRRPRHADARARSATSS